MVSIARHRHYPEESFPIGAGGWHHHSTAGESWHYLAPARPMESRHRAMGTGRAHRRTRRGILDAAPSAARGCRLGRPEFRQTERPGLGRGPKGACDRPARMECTPILHIGGKAVVPAGSHTHVAGCHFGRVVGADSGHPEPTPVDGADCGSAQIPTGCRARDGNAVLTG
jgi:hypothetical protein